MKVTKEDLKRMYPLEDIKASFMERPDIAAMPEDERERLWEKQREGIDNFMGIIAQHDVLILSPEVFR